MYMEATNGPTKSSKSLDATSRQRSLHLTSPLSLRNIREGKEVLSILQCIAYQKVVTRWKGLQTRSALLTDTNLKESIYSPFSALSLFLHQFLNLSHLSYPPNFQLIHYLFHHEVLLDPPHPYPSRRRPSHILRLHLEDRSQHHQRKPPSSLKLISFLTRPSSKALWFSLQSQTQTPAFTRCGPAWNPRPRISSSRTWSMMISLMGRGHIRCGMGHMILRMFTPLLFKRLENSS